jgi:two-component system, cell cycle response regulator
MPRVRRISSPRWRKRSSRQRKREATTPPILPADLSDVETAYLLRRKVNLKSKKEPPPTKNITEMAWESLPQSFLYTTAQRLTGIKKDIERLQSVPGDKKAFSDLKLTFHKIAGSSGVYGYPDLGAIAKRSERGLLAIERGEESLDDARLKGFFADALEMEAMLNAVIKGDKKMSIDLSSTQEERVYGQILDPSSEGEKQRKIMKILVVDDDETILEIVERYLSRAGYTIKTAINGKSALEEVFKFSPDMVILDIILPDIDGTDLLKIIRQRPGGNILPIMFLTAKDTLDDRIQGLSIGGDDYITKPFYPEELLARVGALIARTTLLKELAVRDGLTGTYNHRYFYEKLSEEITRWKRYNRKFTLVIIDLDFFKSVNDTYGHVVGDLVLRETADFLKARLRNVDVVARYGGEEFGIILPETDLKDAHLVLRRIYERLNAWKIRVPGIEEPLQITFSAGLATCPDDGDDEKTLVAHADKALYYAKESGRNQFILYRDMARIMQRNREVEEDVDDAGHEECAGKPLKEGGFIFVAEDDHLISNMLKLYLEKEGFRVKTFPNGAELLAIINLEKPDVIILDVMMPLMDGLKTLEIIKSQDDIRGIPVIMLTSLDDRQTIEMHRKLGAVSYIQKPFNPEVLLNVIRKHIC